MRKTFLRSVWAAPMVDAESLAAALGLALHGDTVAVDGVASVERARSTDLAFHDGPGAPPPTAAGLLIARAPRLDGATILSEDPRAAFIDAVPLVLGRPRPAGIHPRASVHPTARLGVEVTLHPGVVVGPRCVIGDRTELFPHVVLYADTVLGADVRVHAGAVLGADGFGYHPTASGLKKMPHVGRVVVEDGVEIGANACIDRAALGETRVRRGAKLDNLVQVAHNCDVGEGAVLVAQTGLSGSVIVGAGAQLGGQAGVADHRSVGARARVGAQSGVHRDVPDGEAVLGTPARPLRQTRRIWAALAWLPELVRRS